MVKRFGSSTIRQRISIGPTPASGSTPISEWLEEHKFLKVAFPVNVNTKSAPLMRSSSATSNGSDPHEHEPGLWPGSRCAPTNGSHLSARAKQGVALLNDSKYGHDVHRNVMRLTLLRSPKAPDPLCDMGRHRFTYALVPHFLPYNYAGIVAAAYALNAPVRHAFLASSPGEAGSLPALVACENRNIVVETVKKAEDSNDIVVRLYECHNSRGKSELSCAMSPKRAVLLRSGGERDRGVGHLSDGLVSFDFKPVRDHHDSVAGLGGYSGKVERHQTVLRAPGFTSKSAWVIGPISPSSVTFRHGVVVNSPQAVASEWTSGQHDVGGARKMKRQAQQRSFACAFKGVEEAACRLSWLASGASLNGPA